MEYIQLRYFAEVARLQSFSKAAETLHISQPSLSRAIKGMEDELGVVLFDRTTRYLRLTDDGEIVLRHAAAALSMSRDLLSTLNEGESFSAENCCWACRQSSAPAFLRGLSQAFGPNTPESGCGWSRKAARSWNGC